MPDQPTEKTCTKCGEMKPLDAFGTQKGGRLGLRARCKVCRTEELKAWRKTESGKASTERGKDKTRERQARWYRQNRGSVKARVRANAKRDPKKASARSLRYYYANKERIAEKRRVYYEANRARFLERAKEWATANPDRRREIAAAWDKSPQGRMSRRQRASRRRARTLALPTEDIDFMVVFERDDGVCGLCGEPVDPDDWHLDHIMPLARGGHHVYGNVQVAHPTCNISKGARVSKGKVI